jgi:hypothetical protein
MGSAGRVGAKVAIHIDVVQPGGRALGVCEARIAAAPAAKTPMT